MGEVLELESKKSIDDIRQTYIGERLLSTFGNLPSDVDLDNEYENLRTLTKEGYVTAFDFSQRIVKKVLPLSKLLVQEMCGRDAEVTDRRMLSKVLPLLDDEKDALINLGGFLRFLRREDAGHDKLKFYKFDDVNNDRDVYVVDYGNLDEYFSYATYGTNKVTEEMVVYKLLKVAYRNKMSTSEEAKKLIKSMIKGVAEDVTEEAIRKFNRSTLLTIDKDGGISPKGRIDYAIVVDEQDEKTIDLISDSGNKVILLDGPYDVLISSTAHVTEKALALARAGKCVRVNAVGSELVDKLFLPRRVYEKSLVK